MVLRCHNIQLLTCIINTQRLHHPKAENSDLKYLILKTATFVNIRSGFAVAVRLIHQLFHYTLMKKMH